VNFAAITLCVASQRLIPKVDVYSFMDSVRKLLDTPSCNKEYRFHDEGIDIDIKSIS
jgi:hypothetical protein